MCLSELLLGVKPCSQSDARSCGSLRNVVAEVCERNYAKPQTSASSSGGSAGDGPEVYLSVACVAVDQLTQNWITRKNVRNIVNINAVSAAYET